ncbi:glutathione S-transferase family protein [Glaciecola petra]|uniref:Glutathione S-transferase family protein n=1 Tax=Glaciecola petra TaxID=3075602 RepID=A0ABU2ZTB1_9ALTE|nr:glutathione S-transferase family protein [Aestuariibacter sp. P117]MDT0595496.1 glutathione S-transferase family protein [Aestuariibacter sp. P117]
MQLYGSITSPYVRRLRIFMHEMPYDFVQLDIFKPEDRALIASVNPTLKIPMLKDVIKGKEQIILDSRLIYQYLQKKNQLAELSWDQENVMTSIDAANDSLVQMFILSRSQIDVSEDKLYFTVQRERIDVIFVELNKQAIAGEFEVWHYLSMCLFCLLDWVSFRNLYDFSEHTALVELYDSWQQLAICHQTDPRHAT